MSNKKESLKTLRKVREILLAIIVIALDIFGALFLIFEEFKTGLKPFGILYATVTLMTTFCMAATVMQLMWLKYRNEDPSFFKRNNRD